MAAAAKIADRYKGAGRINRPSEVPRAGKLLSHYRFANIIEIDGETQIFETPLDHLSRSEAREFQMYMSWAKNGMDPNSFKGTAFAEDEEAYREFLEEFPLSASHTRIEDARSQAICKGRTGADYIATTIRNRSGDTLTLRFLVLDLDADRAEDRFKTDGAIDWQKAGPFLVENEPRLIERLSKVLPSPGGKGLHLVIEISPFQLGLKSMALTEFLAKTVLRRLNVILDWHGLGADPSAKSLDRWVANWENKDILLDEDTWRNTRKKAESRRDRVLTDLFEYTRRHPALRPTKDFLFEKGKILYPDARTELKLAKLYDHLLKADGCLQKGLSFSDIIGICGLAENTLRKVMKCGLPWLKFEGSGKAYDLQLMPTIKFTRRCRWLLQEGVFKFELHEPEFVLDGERFNWIGSLAAHCKQHGVTQERLEQALPYIIPRVPGWETSRNLTSNLPALIRAIYRNQEDLDGNRIGQQMIPWVEAALEQAEGSPIINPFWHLKSSCKKGGDIPVGNKPLIPPSAVSIPECQSNTELSSSMALFSESPEPVRPGSLRAGQALSPVVDAVSSGALKAEGESVPSDFQLSVVDTGKPEIYPAGGADFLSRTLDPTNVAWALSDVARGQSTAAGMDRIVPAQLEKFWRTSGTGVATLLAAGRYEPVPVRTVDIFKTGGGSRTISILSVVDRMLLKMIDRVLKPHIEPQFSRWSFGWRPGVGPRQALAAANRHVADGFEWVGATDVKDCFSGIDHAMLLEVLKDASDDQLLVSQISRFLRCWSPGGTGIVQGSPLSPLLANLFLNQLDQHLASKGIRFCRYGDDIRVFARTRADAEAALILVGEKLGRLRLQMNQDKTMTGHASTVIFCQKPLEGPRPGSEDDPSLRPLPCAPSSNKARQPQKQDAGCTAVSEGAVVPGSVRNPLELSDDQIYGEFSLQVMRASIPGELKMGLLNALAGMSHEDGISAQRQYLTSVYLQSLGIDPNSFTAEEFKAIKEGRSPIPCNRPTAAPIETASPEHASGRFDHLTGSALSATFSKALMKSSLPAAEKARILTEVTSIADIKVKEKARREWLAKLT
jgi:group II intron reverse transcriptase/maturase